MIVLATSQVLDTLLIGAIGLVMSAPGVARIAARCFDPFEPIVLFVVAYGVMFVVRPAAMMITDSIVFVGPRRNLDVSTTFTEMLFLALLGALGFVGGYWLPLGAALAKAHRSPPPGRNTRGLAAAALLVGLVGIAAFALLIGLSSGLDVIGTIYRSGNMDLPDAGSASMYGWFLFLLLVPATLVLLVLGLQRRSKGLIITSLVSAALVVTLAFPLGSRITLLPFFGGLFVLYYVRRGARPSLATVVLFAVVAVFASTFLSDLRGRSTRGETVAETIVRSTSPSRLADSTTKGPDSDMAPALAAALSVIPERMGHTYGKTIFADLAMRPLPRSLWHGKPQIPRKKLIAEIWPIEYERGSINTEFSALLYFYWDFGLLGICLGLAAYGILARYLYEYFLLHDAQLYAQVFYSLSLWFVVIGLRDSPADTFVRAVFVVVPVWAIFTLARVPILARSGRSLPADPRAA